MVFCCESLPSSVDRQGDVIPKCGRVLWFSTSLIIAAVHTQLSELSLAGVSNNRWELVTQHCVCLLESFEVSFLGNLCLLN